MNISGEQYMAKPDEAIAILNKNFGQHLHISRKGDKLQLELKKDQKSCIEAWFEFYDGIYQNCL
jgi:hypothetical protein